MADGGDINKGISSGADLLRFATAGSVDDGKSTLIGRLLTDSRHVYEDHLAALVRDSERRGAARGEVELALLLDGLKAEREQNITIDVAYRYFSTPRRSFIIADTPGHEQYTRNMATGASTADLAVILIDARNGITTQTRRHSFIMSLLGVRHIVVAVNKMDLVGYDRTVFEKIQREYLDFSAKLQFADIRFLPLSALRGDNVVTQSEHMSWYDGVTLLSHLETVQITGDRNLVDLRFPIQYVLRPNQDFRGYAGTVASGTIRPGTEVMVLPSGRTSRVRAVRTADGELDEAFPPLAVTIELEDELDISRGDMLVHPNNLSTVTATIEAMVVWMDARPLAPGREYIVKHTTAQVRGAVNGLRYRVDVNTMHRETAGTLILNEIGRVSLALVRPLFVDSYERNRATGGFILIDPVTNTTVGAGMIVDRRPSDLILTPSQAGQLKSGTIRPHKSSITNEERAVRLGQQSATVWLTGLPKSGKSTIAYALERRLFDLGCTAHVLDGENLRANLSSDLGFSADDRLENIRRAAGVARIANDLGLVTIAAFVSPYAAIRANACEIIGPDRFIEVYVNASVETCEARDKNGLYKRARHGDIPGFTGISAPFEAPEHPDMVIETERMTVDDAVNAIVHELVRRKIIREDKKTGDTE